MIDFMQISFNLFLQLEENQHNQLLPGKSHGVWIVKKKTSLGGGFNPFEKYDRQIGSSPQVRVKTKNI